MIAQMLVSAFFAACFLQSGLDKVFDWKGNLSWLTGHFAQTPLKALVPMMLASITVLEVVAGATCLAGLGIRFFAGTAAISAFGLGLAGLALTLLFAGQRIAKDYAGAATLASYFGVALLGLWLCSLGTA